MAGGTTASGGRRGPRELVLETSKRLTLGNLVLSQNNPLTKEPKLDRARRQIPEWTVYDDEVAALARRVAAGRKEGGRAGEAFAVQADELGQAVQQRQEREELVEGEMGRGRDEL